MAAVRWTAARAAPYWRVEHDDRGRQLRREAKRAHAALLLTMQSAIKRVGQPREQYSARLSSVIAALADEGIGAEIDHAGVADECDPEWIERLAAIYMSDPHAETVYLTGVRSWLLTARRWYRWERVEQLVRRLRRLR